MADTLTGTVELKLAWSVTDALDLANVQDVGRVMFSQAISDGTGANAATTIWHDTRTVAASANDDLDLTALTQTIYGSTVTKAFSKVKLILVIVTTTTTGAYLKIGGSGGHEWAIAFGATGDIAKAGAGSPFILANLVDGYAVVDGVTDILRINNPSASDVTYKIVVLGS